MNEVRRAARRSQRGVILLDALLAIFLGTTVFMAILGMFITNIAAAKAAQQNTVVCNCARHILENLRLRRSANVPDGTYSDPTVFGSVPEMSQLLNATASVAVTTQGSVKVVNITVNWKPVGARSLSKSRVFTGMISARGVAL